MANERGAGRSIFNCVQQVGRAGETAEAMRQHNDRLNQGAETQRR